MANHWMEKAKLAIDRFFGGTSVSVNETRSGLEDLREQIDVLIGSLPSEEEE
ncbi:MAG: hypothetical protein U0990_09685 [Candidatus Nanopelagicales bacterium]|nr:hypothetical protein [Candidatus Nanopelagicales bacterium]